MNDLKFDNLGLKDSILKSIQDLGYETPSPIQAESIPVVLEGFDLIGQAQTGTGKTAAFGLSMLNDISAKDGLGALILAPTRELAIQVYEELVKLSKYEKLTILPVYGGSQISTQIRALRGNVNIVVGTPGRVLDLMHRKALKLDTAKFLVLDEADEMLNMGFIEDIEEIIKSMPEERQTLLFSATMPPQIKKLASKYMKSDAKHVAIKKNSLTVSKIAQYYYEIANDQRFEALCRIIDHDAPNASIIFCRTKKGVDELVEAMQSKGYIVEGMHGDMSQQHRMRTLKKFKDGALSFLVATDVAARGIDVDGITHVFNYDLPQDPESYVHRIGRTGRANREGTACTLVSPREFSMLGQIRKVTKSDIIKKDVPTVTAIHANKFGNMIEEVSGIIEQDDYSKFTESAKELCEKFAAVDVVAALMKNQFVRELSFEYETDALPAPRSGAFRSSSNGSSAGSKNDTRLFISVGRRDGLTVKGLLTYIEENASVKGASIRNIDIMENFTFVNVDSGIVEDVMDKCIGGKINKRKVNIEISNNSRKKRR